MATNRRATPPASSQTSAVTRLALVVVVAFALGAAAGCDDDGGCDRGGERPARGRKRRKRLPRVVPTQPFSGRVTRVSDGDTIWVTLAGGRKRAKIRLYGIDAPERSMPFGAASRRELRALVMTREVRVVPVARDRYRRVVGKVFRGERDVGAALLSAGLAWHYKRYDKNPAYGRLERDARAAKRGLWSQTTPMAPWTFRRQRRRKR